MTGTRLVPAFLSAASSGTRVSCCEAAVASLTRYRDIFEVSPIAQLLTDSVGVIAAINPAAALLCAEDRDALFGRPLTEILENAGSVPLGAVTADLVRGDGTKIRVLVSADLIERGTCWLWTMRELTAHNADGGDPDDRDVRIAELERKLREKEELLERERVQCARLERAERARERFIAVLSHDLRAPIHSVLGWTQLVRREVLSDAARDRALATIERSARSQLGLVEDLLDVTRISSGKLRLDLQPVNVSSLVRRVVDELTPTAVEHGVDLEYVSAPSDLTAVFADRRRLQQVVSNLVANALKFTPSSGKCTVSVLRDGEHVVIRVKDTGRGISPSLLPGLFEPFQQEGGNERAPSGLGLGLFIVRHLVELHRGTVQAFSEGSGRGATFVARLPLRDVPTAPESAAHLLVTANIEPGMRLDGVRVLVVEDDADARELIQTVLAHGGADVVVAASVASALNHFDAFHPDVVVSDIGMPGQDGYDLVGRLRRIAPDVSAIAISGFATPTDAARALDAGFDVHFAKPIEPMDLVRAVRTLARPRHR